jgi:hypothetical protein
VPRAEAPQKQGKPPISVKWVDVNKGDDTNPEYESQLVASEIRRFGEEPIFAPTPPLASLRTILSFAAADLPGRPAHGRDPDSERRTQISFIDIKRAYLCAKTDPEDPTYVEFPKEHPWSKDKDACGLLLKHMYGTRKAGDGWHVEISATLTEKLGFTKGDASACICERSGDASFNRGASSRRMRATFAGVRSHSMLGCLPRRRRRIVHTPS